jgi:riboflavin kinase/FMN adenylyltransferase
VGVKRQGEVIFVQVDPFSDIGPVFPGGVISIGNFDGVHRGHCRLLARLRDRAREKQVDAIAVSFEPHPLRWIRPESAPASLVWPERKEELLRQCGADVTILLSTTRDFLNLSAEAFFHDVVLDRLRALGMVEGRNFCYGRSRGGTVELLAEQCKSASINLDVVDIIEGNDRQEISSSQVRRELVLGRVEQATKILGRPHRMKGRVVVGDQRGRSIGFPTANLVDIPVMLPREGVYACRAWLRGRSWPAAVNIGGNPTFDIAQQKVEAHLLDFEGDLYGQQIELDLLALVRDVQKFASLEDLKNQLANDIATTRRIERAYQHPFGCDLGQTIREWIELELADTIAPLQGRLGRVRLEGSVLRAELGLAGPSLPSWTVTGQAPWEERLRRAFPEVKWIEWEKLTHPEANVD